MATTFAARGRIDEDDPGTDDRRRKVAVMVSAVVVVVLVLTWLVGFSSVFGVRTVDVNGVHVLTPAQVRRVAAIGQSTPLIRLDTAAVERRVETLPDVAGAHVRTSFPSTVVITVDERVAVGFVRNGEAISLVDRSGYQYRTVPTAPNLPEFDVATGADARTTGSAVAAVATALPAHLLTGIASIQALDPNSITLVLDDGRSVRWGSATRNADKARILPVLLRQPGAQFDVTDPDLPFTRGTS